MIIQDKITCTCYSILEEIKLHFFDHLYKNWYYFVKIKMCGKVNQAPI